MNNYQILGLTKNASINDIKRKYRMLAMEYHPDKTQGDVEKTKKFINIKNAYEELLDGKTGEIYKPKNKKGKNKNVKDGTFIVKNITMNKNTGDCYIHVTLTNIKYIIIVGKYFELGRYTINNQYFDGNLTISKEDLKKLKYKITLKFVGTNGNSASKTYKIKNNNLFTRFVGFIGKLINFSFYIFIIYICIRLIMKL